MFAGNRPFFDSFLDWKREPCPCHAPVHGSRGLDSHASELGTHAGERSSQTTSWARGQSSSATGGARSPRPATGPLATFEGPGRRRSVRCRGSKPHAPRRLRMRAGVHIGEVELVDRRRGVAVHEASRSWTPRTPDEILVSELTRTIAETSGLRFQDRGARRSRARRRVAPLPLHSGAMSDLLSSWRSTRTPRRCTGSPPSCSATRATTRSSAARRPRLRWRSWRRCVSTTRRSPWCWRLVGRRSSRARNSSSVCTDLHPHAKRALLIPWGGWADEETADAIRTAMALGHIDYYALKPWSTPDELFHRLVSEFLQEWRRQNAPGRRELTVVADPWSSRVRATEPARPQRRAACVPHVRLD